MNEKYIQLFKEITKSTAIIAEQVMDMNHNQNDKKGEETAKIMRDDFTKLNDKINVKNFDAATLTKAEFAKLLVCTLIIVNNFKERIKNMQQAVNGYETDVIPKLQKIVDITDESKIPELIQELFTIK